MANFEGMSDTMDAQELADRYVAVWNETDDAKRRQAIHQLWAQSGEHYVGTRQAIGYEELEKRVIGSHQKNVRDAGNRFRAMRDAQQLRNAVSFHWEMLRGESEDVAAVGLEFLLVDDAGRVLVDYQFIVK